MYRDHTVGVVVPAYNEEGFVGEVLETVPAFVDRVYVIDDGSSDDTWSEIQTYASAADRTVSDGGVDSPDSESRTVGDGRTGAVADRQTTVGGAFDQRIVPIRHEQNKGVGGSVTTGYQRALADELDVTAVMNGDGQMDPDRLPDLLDPIVEDRADYAKGNRLLYPEHRAEMSGWRLFGNAVLSGLTKVASGYWRTLDPQNGYTAISKEALTALELDELYTDYGFCNDVLIQLNALDMRIADVAMPAVYGDEESSIRYSTFVPGLSSLLLQRFVWRLGVKYGVREGHPLVLLYLLGAASIGVGSVAALATLAARRRPALVLSSVVLVAVGATALVIGMILDRTYNSDLEVRVDGS